jgi:hypothetical protein
VTRQRPLISSSLLGNLHVPLLLLFTFAFTGCGGESPEQATCENLETPDLLTLRDVTPAEGSTIANEEITHSFTVVGASGTFGSLTFAFGANHDAGVPDPDALKFEPAPSGADMVYTFEPVVWEKAGHVELVETGEYSDSTRCYILPRPLFSYDVTE